MQMTPFQWIVVIATPVLQIMILNTLGKKNLRTKFPIFYNFLLFSVVAEVLQTALIQFSSPAQYFFMFWTLGAINMILGLGIIYEVFLNILRPYNALLDFAKILFRWAGLFLLLASVLTALATTGSEQNKICAAIQLFDRVVGLMQCGLLLLVLLFETRLGLSWRNPAICIAVGMGAFAAIDLGSTLLRDRIPAWEGTLNVVTAVLCVAVSGAWMYAFALVEPRKAAVQDAPSRLILQRWNEVLMSTPLVTPQMQELAFSPVDSFIPGVEKAVDRVLSRKMSQ